MQSEEAILAVAKALVENPPEERYEQRDGELILVREYRRSAIAALEAALSAADPRGYLVHDKDNPDGRYFKQKPSISDDDMSEYEIWIEPLYAAPTAPSVAVKPLMTVEEYVDGYCWRGDEGDYTPNEQEKALLVDALHGAIGEVDADFVFASRHNNEAGECESLDIGSPALIKLKEKMAASALTAQVQDVAGWHPITNAPKDGMTVDLWDSVAQERVADARFINGNWKIWGQNGFGRMEWVTVSRQEDFTHFMHLPSAPSLMESKP